MKFEVIDIKGNKKDELNLEIDTSSIDEDKANHLVYLLDNYQKNYQKVPCASSKTRSMVRGGGAKPYKQKGTGNARRGTNRTPLRRGGGVIFGPHPHNYKTKLNNKKISKALQWIISSKSEACFVLDVDQDKPLKTKESQSLLNKLKRTPDQKVTVVTEHDEVVIQKAFKNIANVYIEYVSFTKASKLVYSRYIVFTRRAFEKITERINNDN